MEANHLHKLIIISNITTQTRHPMHIQVTKMIIDILQLEKDNLVAQINQCHMQALHLSMK